MMEQTHDALQRRGVEASRIAEERFTSPEARSRNAGSAKTELVRVSHAGHEHGIQVEPGQSILEAALAAGIDMPFSCAMGGCGACRVRRVAGDVDMEEPNCLSRERTRTRLRLDLRRPPADAMPDRSGGCMTARSEAVDLDEARWMYRMKDLCEATGLPRQAIHFYIQQGLSHLDERPAETWPGTARSTWSAFTSSRSSNTSGSFP